jgi:hypothetical protein
MRGRKIKGYIIDEIVLLKREHPELSARSIRENLLAIFPGKREYIPKVREIYNILERNKDKIVLHELDARWSLGAYHDMSLDTLKKVIEIQRMMSPHDRFLTARRAKWISILCPLLAPVDNFSLLQISAFYSLAEQLSEITKTPLNTRDLDERYIIKRDVSRTGIVDDWLRLYYPIGEETGKTTKALSTAPATIAVPEEQKPAFAKFITLLVQSTWDIEKRTELHEYMQVLPDEMQASMVQWLSLNTRRDIMRLSDEIKQEDKSK